MKDLLEEAGLRSEAKEVFNESANGFYESVGMEDMMDEGTLLVYEMNGGASNAGERGQLERPTLMIRREVSYGQDSDQRIGKNRKGSFQDYTRNPGIGTSRS